MRAIGESGVHVGRAGGWEHHAAPGGARFSSGSFGRDPRSGLVFAYATLPLAREASAVRGGVQVSEDGGRSWKAANGTLLDAAPRGRARGELGRSQGLDAVARADRRVRAFPAGGLRRAPRRRAAGPRRGGVERHREDERRRAQLERRPRRVRPAVREPRRLLDRAARRRGRALGLVRLALRPRGRSRTRPTSRSRRTSSARTGRPTAAPPGRRRTPCGAATIAGRRAAST